MINLFFETLWVFIYCLLGGIGLLIYAGAALVIILIFILPIIVIFTLFFGQEVKMNDKIFKIIDNATRQGYTVRFNRDEVQPENIMITLVKDNYCRMYTMSTFANYNCADLFLGNVLESVLEEARYDWNEAID